MSDLSKKRRKKFFGGGAAKKSKYALNLTAGIKGFLCTHNGHPKFCIREVYNILDEFSESGQSKNETSQVKQSVEDDFEAELKKDIENVQNKSKEKEFQVVETGVIGCVFIKSTSGNPSEIMDKIIRKIIDTRKCQSRKILRMIPIQVTCKAYLDDITKAMIPLLDKHFKGDAKTYAIVVNRRHNSNIMRNELINALGLLIRDRNPFHSADLKKPQLTILIEILKSVCCLTVLADYNKHRKYNLVELGFACQNSNSELLKDGNDEKTDSSKVINQEDNSKNNDEVKTDDNADKAVNDSKTDSDSPKNNADKDPELIKKENSDTKTDVPNSENVKDPEVI